jgi:hypothetical protein
MMKCALTAEGRKPKWASPLMARPRGGQRAKRARESNQPWTNRGIVFV